MYKGICIKCTVSFILFIAITTAVFFFVWKNVSAASDAVDAQGSIVINEVAWAGTAESASKEWIELWNGGQSPVALSGWKLTAEDGTPSVTLTGTIPAQGFFVLTRGEKTKSGAATTNSALTANQFYKGALNNAGENLALYDAKGTLMDEIQGISSWPAGDAPTRSTLARFGNTWRSGVPDGTPGEENAFQGSVMLEKTGESFMKNDNTAENRAVEITPYSIADFNNALRLRTERAVTFRPFLTFGAILALAGMGYIIFIRAKKNWLKLLPWGKNSGRILG